MQAERRRYPQLCRSGRPDDVVLGAESRRPDCCSQRTCIGSDQRRQRAHTCAVDADATVDCWGGEPYYGQALVPAGLSSVIQVSAGHNHSCALKADGAVICWGNNGAGQSTVPPGLNLLAVIPQSISFTSTPPDPARFGASYTVSAMGGASGNPVTFSSLTPAICAVVGDTVTFVGIGSCIVGADQSAGGAYMAAPQVTQTLSTSTSPQVSAGARHTCDLQTNGTVLCGDMAEQVKRACRVVWHPVVRLSTGSDHNCAVRADGTVVCWGVNNRGQATVPIGLGPVADTAVGDTHTCAVKKDGIVACWGNNSSGQTLTPVGLMSVTQVSAGRSHSCAVKADGAVVCWGSNSYGQSLVPVGLTPVAERLTPEPCIHAR